MFIVIEGIDGAGCETQATQLYTQLQQAGKKTFYLKFPHYDTPVGKMIRDFLYERKKHTAQEQFLLYTLQFIFDKMDIQKKSKEGILIVDRYFTTTLCYQALEGISEQMMIDYASMFQIVKPDRVFYLDVPPDTAIKWKYGEQKQKNFREEDHVFIRRTYEKYDDLVKRNVWTNWTRINGNQPKDTVTHILLQSLL